MARPKTYRTPEETEEYLKSRRQRMTETQRRFRERMKAVNPPKEKKRRKRKPKSFTPEEEEEHLKAKRKRRAVNQRRYWQKIKMRKQNDDLNAQLGVNLENEDPEAYPPKQLKIKDLTPEEREEYFKSRRRRMTETQRRYRERIKKKKLNGEPTPQRVRRKVKPSGARVEKPWAKTIMSLPWVNTEEEEQERIRLKRQKMTEYQRCRRERIRNEKQKGDPNYEGTKKNSQRITRVRNCS